MSSRLSERERDGRHNSDEVGIPMSLRLHWLWFTVRIPQISTLRRQLGELKDTNSSLQRQLALSRDSLAASTSPQSASSTSNSDPLVATLQAENGSLRTQISSLRTQNEDTEARNRALLRDIESLQRKVKQ